MLHTGQRGRYGEGMETPTPPKRAQLLMVPWVLWGAFMVGVMVMFHFLHNKKPPAADGAQLWMAALVPLLISLIIRWNVIPRVTVMQSALAFMIMGIALAESVLFLGIFLFPAHQFTLFLAALLGIAQHAPI
ncbi:MAG: hypothetical protein WCF18_20690, partial [Chthoniobacteraceae bacterium]